jgi:ABC-2 type transport system permease protein
MNTCRIAWNDLRRLTKDWQAILWVGAMPLLFAFIFGSAFKSRGPSKTWIPVVDLDKSELSALLIPLLGAPDYWIETCGSERLQDLKERWPYGIVIPQGFSENVFQGKRVDLTVVKGNGSPEKILEIQSRLTQALVRFTIGLVTANVSHQPWNTEVKAKLKASLAQPQSLTVSRGTDRSLRPPPSGFQLSLPGMLVMFVLQMMVIYGGTTLVSDRVKGQFFRLLAAPVRPAEIFLGKLLARIVLALVQAGLILVSGVFLFGMSLGDQPWFLFPVIGSFALFAGSLSILCGLIAGTEKQVVQIAIFATMILCALGGCWWPIEIVPDFFKNLANCLPTYWGVHGIQSVLYFGKGIEVLTFECPILLALAALVLLLAVPLAARLRRRGAATS